MDGKAEETEGPVDEGGGDHEAWVEGAADDAAERVPALGVEPVPEFIEALLSEVQGGAVVEVRVEFVDHGLVSEDAEETGDKSENVD